MLRKKHCHQQHRSSPQFVTRFNAPRGFVTGTSPNPEMHRIVWILPQRSMVATEQRDCGNNGVSGSTRRAVSLLHVIGMGAPVVGNLTSNDLHASVEPRHGPAPAGTAHHQ
jgi:hypothetical protein